MKALKDSISPPKWANQFLEWYCNDDLIDEIQGDLVEAFHYRKQEVGHRKARLWFIWDVVRFFRPSSFKKRSYNSNQFAMLKNYLIVSLRNFKSQKAYSFINLSGLIVGISACLLISLHVMDEVSYDTFHPRAEQTYRIVMDMYGNGELKVKSAPIYPAVGPNIIEEWPEIDMYTRILPFGGGVYSKLLEDGTSIRYNEEKAVLADENFFEMFGFELIDGDIKSVLDEPNEIVLSRTAAERYFGSDNPIGESIYWRGTRELKVSGVFEDFPKNSHMDFELISSLKSWDGFEEWPNNWGWYDFYTFVKVADNISQPILDAKLATYLDVKKKESHEKFNIREELWSQNIGDIHLHSSNLGWDMGQNGGAEQIYFLSIIALLILLIAWVNYVNLATARAIKRAKEVGIRKVIGALKSNLVSQFLVESFLYNALAVLVSVALVWLLVPVVNQRLDVSLGKSLLLDPKVVGGLLLLIVIGTICAGLYPAMVLTSFIPVRVLKGQIYSRKKRFGFRQMLVVFQFTASITLILGTFLVVKQLNFMRSQDLGLNIEQTLVLRAPSSGTGDEDLINRLKVYRAALEALPEVKGFTMSNVVPGIENFAISGFTSPVFKEDLRDCYQVGIDDEFLELFDISIVEGRSFNRELKTDTGSVLINLVAMKHLGYNTPEEAIGEKLNYNSDAPLTIIGVVENYHQADLKKDLDPVVFSYNRREFASYYSLKVNSTDYASTIKTVETQWNKIYPDNPFDYFFLDELFDRQYKSDEQFNAVFIGFAGLAIFVACLGLFGLVSFTAEQSRKEIGIRKVLGASASKLVMLLAKDYARLIIVAVVIAFPLAYFLMQEWLKGFAYQTQISVGVFVFGALVIALVSFVTVSFKSFSAANGNPVNALRDE